MEFQGQEEDSINTIITQLCSSGDLSEESINLFHCVHTYANRCVNGICSIWSLREFINGKWIPKVTIEVSKKNHIEQIKGKYNVAPEQKHLDMIRTWALREKLTFQDLLMN